MHEKREDGPIPAGQRFYDNIFLLLVLGVVVPTLIYTVWGLLEIMYIPRLPIVP